MSSIYCIDIKTKLNQTFGQWGFSSSSLDDNWQVKSQNICLCCHFRSINKYETAVPKMYSLLVIRFPNISTCTTFGRCSPALINTTTILLYSCTCLAGLQWPVRKQIFFFTSVRWNRIAVLVPVTSWHQIYFTLHKTRFINPNTTSTVT